MSTKAADALRSVPTVGDLPAGATVLLDEAAFNSLYHSTAAPLRAYATRVLGNAMAADDIVQETYLRVLRRPVPAAQAVLRPYVFRIATHLMTDVFRQQQRERRAGSGEMGVERPRDAALAIDMERMFLQLRPRDRQLMWLAHVEEYDHREIAAAVGVRERSVRVLLSRARRKLAAMLRAGGRTREAR